MVLTGAVVKGAFEAGALEVIASREIQVRRIVATSSGALNGTAFAAGVRARREVEAARDLVMGWEENASLCAALHPNLRAILERRGISDHQKILAMLRRQVRPCTLPDPAPIELHMVMAALRGGPGRIDSEPATKYSQILSFSSADFDTSDALERIFVAAIASAALPVLFAPVNVPGVGPCIDGSLVSNTPLRAAFGLATAEALDAILVVAPTPALAPAPLQKYRGFRLVDHVLDMVFTEWLYQDLRRATRLNEGLARLDALAVRRGWSAAEVAEIKVALELQHARNVPVVSIRPEEALPGTLFSGFTDAGVRRAYIQIGRERATQVLDALGWR